MISEIRNILIISKYTFFEVVKSKILLNVFFLGLGLLFLSYAATEFTFGVPTKVALDFGFGALSFSAIGISIFIGVNIINKEIETRTIYIMLSQPISRYSFFIGRVLGMSLLLLVNIVILSSLMLIIYFSLGGDFQPLIIWCILFSFLEAVIVLNITILFSLVTNVTMSVVYSLIFFIIGHSINNFLSLIDSDTFEIFYKIGKFTSYFIPDLSKINIKEFLLYQKNLELSYLMNAFIYAFFVNIILMTLSAGIFRNKDLN